MYWLSALCMLRAIILHINITYFEIYYSFIFIYFRCLNWSARIHTWQTRKPGSPDACQTSEHAQTDPDGLCPISASHVRWYCLEKYGLINWWYTMSNYRHKYVVSDQLIGHCMKMSIFIIQLDLLFNFSKHKSCRFTGKSADLYIKFERHRNWEVVVAYNRLYGLYV